MQFMQEGAIYKGIKISGPSHNFLGLIFLEPNEDIKEVKMTPLFDMGSATEELAPEEIKKQVFSGIKEIKNELNMDVKIKEIQYIPSDTPVYRIYKDLTKGIIIQLKIKPTI